MNRENNQRYQMTDRAICAYVLQSLESRSLSSISVKEICEHVGINRSSFYLHYKDVYDLMDRLCEAKLKEIAAQYKALSRQERAFDPMDYLLISAKLCYEDQAFYRVYLKERAFADIEKRMKPLVDRAVTPYFTGKLGMEEREALYHVRYVSAGILAVFLKWISDGCPETPEQLVEWIGKIPGARIDVEVQRKG